MDKSKLLMIEDDEDLRTQMKWALAGEYDVLLAGTREEALQMMQSQRPLVVTLDLGLPPHPAGVEEGLATLGDILSVEPLTKIIVITGRGEKENAMEAVGQGAYDFLQKPVEIADLKVVLKRAYYLSSIEKERSELQHQLGEDSFEGILGNSPKMKDIFATVRKVATTDASVLIHGESGTGKELIARAIHRLSNRRNGPWIVINCGAIPENLLESELFGHEKGSFTGAHAQRKGRIELAHEGTLFLDEIGELPIKLQVKLLRFLQDQLVERVGGREQIPIDTRVIAATNRDLKDAMRDNTFREDLFFRLAVVTLMLPPLRERADDVMLIAKAFLHRYADSNNKKLSGFTNDAHKAIVTYNWPGNVRELENRIKRAVIMSEGRKVSAADLEMTATESDYEGEGLKGAREKLEKDLIQKALTRNKGNVSKAAAELGISRPTLYSLMERTGITTEDGSKD